MLLALRPAASDHVPLLVDLHERAYRGGYSASFDRYGPITPGDLWWVRTEKELLLVEINHRPAGMVLMGKGDGRALVAEEVIVDPAAGGMAAAGEGVAELAAGKTREADPARAALVRRLGAALLQHVRRRRAERFLLRTAEANPLGVPLARTLDLGFVNFLVVLSLHPHSRQAVRPPQGYTIRRAAGADAPELARIYRECTTPAPAPADVEALLQRPGVRAWVAERDRYAVGFLIAEAHRGGFGDLAVGVREGHRRRGLGRALATAAANFFHERQIPAVALVWGGEGGAQAYYRSVGFATERVYLFFERPV